MADGEAPALPLGPPSEVTLSPGPSPAGEEEPKVEDVLQQFRSDLAAVRRPGSPQSNSCQAEKVEDAVLDASEAQEPFEKIQQQQGLAADTEAVVGEAAATVDDEMAEATTPAIPVSTEETEGVKASVQSLLSDVPEAAVGSAVQEAEEVPNSSEVPPAGPVKKRQASIEDLIAKGTKSLGEVNITKMFIATAVIMLFVKNIRG